VQGRVSVLRDGGLREWAIDVGEKVKVREIIVTKKDGHALFQVSDGSTFEVFPNSRIVFRNNERDWSELLDAILGRVRVHVEHKGDVPNPNKIHTPTAVISVRGTTFDISVDDDETTVVQVEEGRVDVRHSRLGGTKTLNPGDQLTVYRDTAIAKSHGGKVLQVVRMAVDAVIAGAGRSSGGGIGSLGGGTVGGGGIGGVGGVGDTDTTGGTGSTGGTPSGGGVSLPNPPSIPSPPGLPGGVIP
jgi:hypothetical protein